MFCKKCGSQLKPGDMFCPRCGMRVGGQGQPRQQNMYYEETSKENNGILYVMIGVLVVLMISVVGFGGYHLLKSRNNSDEVQTTAEADKKSASAEEKKVQSITTTEIPIATATATPVPTATAVPVPTVIATPVPTAVPTVAPVQTGGYYIFPNSSSSYLSYAQVDALSLYEMYLARNEIYAKHGRIFKNSDLQQYFGSQSWYVPMYSPETFDEGVFNAYEKENIKLIKSVEQSYGSPYL